MEDKIFEEINPSSLSQLIITCEHGGGDIPTEYGKLGLSEQELNTHIARDKGARETSALLAQKLGCYAIVGKYSRLLVDLNRRENENELILECSDKVEVPENKNISAAERENRLQKYYRPYYKAISDKIAQIKANGKMPILFSVHSFTPQLKGGDYRPWNAGILWHQPTKLGRFVFDELAKTEGKNVGINVPYDLTKCNTGAVIICGEEKGLDYGLIEIRDDEYDNLSQGAEWWSDKLAEILKKVLKS